MHSLKKKTTQHHHHAKYKHKRPQRTQKRNIRTHKAHAITSRSNTSSQHPQQFASIPNPQHALKNAGTPHTLSKRSMAFSFDKPTSFFLSQQPVTRTLLPWEKHTATAEANVTSIKTNHEIELQPSSPTSQLHQQHLQSTDQTDQQYTHHQSPRFSFSSITPQRSQPSPSSHQNSDNTQQTHNTLVPESRFGGRITSVMAQAIEANKNADVSGVGPNDFETLFANSAYNGVFAQQQVGQSFWAKMTPDGPQQLYFVGSRKFVNLATAEIAAEPVYAFKKISVSRPMRTIREDFTTYSYASGAPASSTMMFTLEPDFTRGSVRDPAPNLPPSHSFRGAVRYRGVPWKWHSSVQMGLITCDPNMVSTPKPDIHHTHRNKFFSDGYIAEKLIREGDRLTMSTVDEMKLVTKEEFDQAYNNAMQGTHDNYM